MSDKENPIHEESVITPPAASPTDEINNYHGVHSRILIVYAVSLSLPFLV